MGGNSNETQRQDNASANLLANMDAWLRGYGQGDAIRQKGLRQAELIVLI